MSDLMFTAADMLVNIFVRIPMLAYELLYELCSCVTLCLNFSKAWILLGKYVFLDIFASSCNYQKTQFLQNCSQHTDAS